MLCLKKTKPSILVKKVSHRNKLQLVLLFSYNYKIKTILSDLGYFWSKTLKGWYIEFTSDNISILKNTLQHEANFKLDASIYKKHHVKPIRKKRTISEKNKVLIRMYVKYLQGKCYSESTIKTNFTFIADFFDYVQDIPISSITNRTVEQFIETVFVPRKYSISTYR